MYKSLLEKSAAITENYARMIEGLVKEEEDPSRWESPFCESLLPEIDRGIRTLRMMAGALENLHYLEEAANEDTSESQEQDTESKSKYKPRWEYRCMDFNVYTDAANNMLKGVKRVLLPVVGDENGFADNKKFLTLRFYRVADMLQAMPRIGGRRSIEIRAAIMEPCLEGNFRFYAERHIMNAELLSISAGSIEKDGECGFPSLTYRVQDYIAYADGKELLRIGNPPEAVKKEWPELSKAGEIRPSVTESEQREPEH